LLGLTGFIWLVFGVAGVAGIMVPALIAFVMVYHATRDQYNAAILACGIATCSVFAFGANLHSAGPLGAIVFSYVLNLIIFGLHLLAARVGFYRWFHA
jgi:hypothetical protein